MTRKHFTAIARVVASLVSHHRRDPGALHLLRRLAHDLASALAPFNPAFDRSRFLIACSLEEDNRA